MRIKRRFEIRLYDQKLMTFSCISSDGDRDLYKID